MAGGHGWRVFLLGIALFTTQTRFDGSKVFADEPAPAPAPTPAPEEPAKKEETRPVIDKTKVYLGCASTCKGPAVVDADKVYRAIPEYKRILDQKLTEKDAEYSILLLKATRKFRAAIESAAKDGSNDLVAAVGGVTWDGHTVPDLTDASVKKAEDAARVGSRGTP